VLILTLVIFFNFAQSTQTGTIVGVVKLPERNTTAQSARVALLPAKYTELFNKQVQQRLDNYWEQFKPEFAANKEHFADFYRMAYLESFAYVTSAMRRDLGSGAAKFIKESSPTGQFELRGIPFGTYQLLVLATPNGRDVVWSRTVDVQTEVPIFVDPGKPVS
jgi:hypothetical protein